MATKEEKKQKLKEKKEAARQKAAEKKQVRKEKAKAKKDKLKEKAKAKKEKLKGKKQAKKDKLKEKKQAKKDKLKEKKQAKKEQAKAKKEQEGKGSMLGWLFKWCFVLGIWCTLILGLILAWYASELHDITQNPQFTRQTSITVLANDGSVIARYGELKGKNVSVKDLPPHLIYAVLATEDRRFYNHFGIDPIGLLRAFYVNFRYKSLVQGGSTITQQLAKNLFLSHEKTFKRKIQEALLALWLEYELSKDDILSAYLNRVYMGSGAYGVDAAARIYFKKPAQNLTLEESAVLAGLLKAPSRYSPLSNPKASKNRAGVVLKAMSDAGYLTKELVENTHTQQTPDHLPKRKPKDGNAARYFSDWVVEHIDELIGTPENDIVIETTLDPDIQKVTAEKLSSTIRKQGKERHIEQGAAVIMRPDGAVVAMVGGMNYKESQFNRATQALRSPGSSFKPLVYLTALEKGWKDTDIIEDAPIRGGRYRPGNFANEYYGKVPLYFALSRSLNTAAVRLAKEIKIENVIGTARRLGILSNLEPNLSLALGSSGVPMIDMTTAYAVLASDGIAVTPHSVTRIKDKNGKILYEYKPPRYPERLFSPYHIGMLVNMMSRVVQEGTGKGAQLPDRFSAGKTGTSQDYRDAWFIGFTDEYVGAIWMGNDDNSSMKRVTGGSFPAATWHDIMLEAHNDETPSSFRKHREDKGFQNMIQGILFSKRSHENKREPSRVNNNNTNPSNRNNSENVRSYRLND